MELRVIGAGWPRTGTNSLKLALERLLGGPCYHGWELLADVDQVPAWDQALAGDISGVYSILGGYAGAVDWPASFFWQELLAASPGATVVLSLRDSAQTWWRSVSTTLVPISRSKAENPGDDRRFGLMISEISRRATGAPNFDDAEKMMQAYERHIETVRATCPADRLVEWRPGDGWAPLCAALGLPIPEEAFPQLNAAEDFAGKIARVFGRS